MPALKRLGITGESFMEVEITGKDKVDVWTIEEYETRIGDPPKLDRYKGEDRAEAGDEPWTM